jgi:hypothetical protein
MNAIVAPKCPRHGTQLLAGPVLYTCETGGGHVVYAADINREFPLQGVSS